MQENRIALIGAIIEQPESTQELNRLLHENARWIIGRMGLPYRSRRVAIISVVLDAPADVVSALSGKLGMLPGVSVKTVYSRESFAPLPLDGTDAG